MTSGIFRLSGQRIWIAGHRGMVGSAIARRLETENCEEILTASRDDLDLRRQSDVEAWVKDRKPEVVFVPAAKVGGIYANDTYPAEFLYDNMMIAANIIHAAHLNDVKKLMFLGSSCIYPKHAQQPIIEDYILTGPLEPTNQWYALAKIAGIKLCQSYRKQFGRDFISAMPTNLYGPGDNFHPENSHVIPALMRKAHEVKCDGGMDLEVWGSGEPYREFLHVDDCADAIVFLMKHYSSESHVNVGSGEELKISELARLIIEVVGLRGDLQFDTSRPDGTPRKLMSNNMLSSLGWTAKTPLRQGLQETYAWYCANISSRAKI